MSDGEENIKVAVRVRPFNKRERGRKAKNIISMNSKNTMVKDPDNPDEDPKVFAYDHSYWSFDGSKEREDGYHEPDPSHPNSNKFCDQQKIYNDLGIGVLENALKGYNATLFAYGQTGSGKSWSVIGYGPNKGIVPLFCDDLFKRINASGSEIQHEVKFSMLEIYNEDVHDLLSPRKSKGGLKIRQHHKKGFYAENLKSVLVTSYQDIEEKMNEGTVNRTIASTNMNATSSRAHTIVGISYIQKSKNAAGQETAKRAVVNLVDLAGSERVSSTGATGERLKEGAAINQSLANLGNCIHALAEQSQGKNIQVPYRSSSLTKLLMNALGGNSKTVMIAAISPADINYGETVSTLQFADRAKQIKTKAVVNEDPTEKLIRELKLENERLKKSMASGQVEDGFVDEDGNGIDDRDEAKMKAEWEDIMKARMLENEREMQNMKKTYEEKLRLSKKDHVDPSLKKKDEEKLTKPHIFNVNQDPQLSYKIVHIIKPGTTTVGNRKGEESDITVVGPSIQPQHATLSMKKDGQVNLKPRTTDCRILVNGDIIQGETTLCHNDRIVFGSTQIWVFQHPSERDLKKTKYPLITYDYAQEEIAAKSGINMGENSDLSGIPDDLPDVMAAVDEANGISEDLDKRVKFEIFLVAPQLVGSQSKRTEIKVKMKNLENGTEFVWEKEKFLNRLYLMKEMYNNFEDDEDEWDRPDDSNPFVESIDTEVHIGTSHVILQPLAYFIELKEQLEITSYKAVELGLINVEIIPCDQNGREYTEADDKFVDTPEELIGTNIYFKFKIHSCVGLPKNYADVYCKYEMYLDNEENETEKISETSNPTFNHVKMFSFTPATKQFVEYLKNGNVVIKVIGKQRIRRSAIPQNQGISTKDLLKKDRQVFSKTANIMNGVQMNGRVVDPQKQSIIVELLLMKKTQARLQQKLDSMRKLVKEAENISKTRISTMLIRDVLNANSPEQADEYIRKLPGK